MKSIKYVVILYVLFSVCSSFSTIKLTASDKFKPGYYLKGTEKIEGFINHGNSNYQFEFKKSIDSKKVKITVDDCDGFFVDDKKFTVLTEVDLKLGALSYHESKAFGEVIIEGSYINLYKVSAVIGAGSSSALVSNYLLKKNNSKKYILAHPNKNKFKQAISDLLKDREDIVSKINDGTYNEKNIEELVKDYNQSK